MKIFVTLTAAIAAILVQPQAGNAQVATDNGSDIECLATMIILSEIENNPEAESYRAAMMYFLGKITANRIDYTAPLEATMRDMTEEQIGDAAQRCASEIEFVGNDMQRRAAEMESAAGEQ